MEFFETWYSAPQALKEALRDAASATVTPVKFIKNTKSEADRRAIASSTNLNAATCWPRPPWPWRTASPTEISGRKCCRKACFYS